MGSFSFSSVFCIFWGEKPCNFKKILIWEYYV